MDFLSETTIDFSAIHEHRDKIGMQGIVQNYKVYFGILQSLFMQGII
jgi:hypothetical protein